MACFSTALLENVLIAFLVICFFVAVFRLLVPQVLSWFGGPPGTGTVMTILGWFIGLLIAIAVIIFAFDMIACLFGNGGLSLRGVR